MVSRLKCDSHIVIGTNVVGPGQKCFVIAEIGQAHDGSLGTAHAYIDAVARAEADAVKFQIHIADRESTPAEQFRVPFSYQDSTRYDYWRRMEFTEEQWRGLKQHAEEKRLVFLASPFSLDAARLLERIGVMAYKIGSGEVSNLSMLEEIARFGKPILLSSGMSGWDDLDAALDCVRGHSAGVAVLQCTTAYPCPPERMGFNVLSELCARYGCPVGISDHSGTIYGSLAAVALGANIVEIHVAFSRECFGPDVPASVTTEELRQLVAGVRFIEAALANPVDKDFMAGELASTRLLFEKSVVVVRPLRAGHRLTPDDVALKKPGTGIPARRINEVIGRNLTRAVKSDHILVEEDIE